MIRTAWLCPEDQRSAQGAISQVDSGSRDNRTTRIHQLMLDLLERLLMDKFTSQSKFDVEQFEQMKLLSQNPSFEGCAVVINSSRYIDFADEYSKFKDEVTEGSMGKRHSFG